MIKYNKIIKEIYNEIPKYKKDKLKEILKLQKAIATLEVYKTDSEIIDRRLDATIKYLDDMIDELYEDGIEDR